MNIRHADPTPVTVTALVGSSYGHYSVDVGETLLGYLSVKDMEIAGAYDKQGDAAGEALTDKLDKFDYAVSQRIQTMLNQHAQLMKLAQTIAAGVYNEKIRQQAEALTGEWDERLRQLDGEYGNPG